MSLPKKRPSRRQKKSLARRFLSGTLGIKHNLYGAPAIHAAVLNFLIFSHTNLASRMRSRRCNELSKVNFRWVGTTGLQSIFLRGFSHAVLPVGPGRQRDATVESIHDFRRGKLQRLLRRRERCLYQQSFRHYHDQRHGHRPGQRSHLLLRGHDLQHIGRRKQRLCRNFIFGSGGRRESGTDTQCHRQCKRRRERRIADGELERHHVGRDE